MLDKEREYYSDSVKLIVGIDEAGRGPLAGPVCAAAVIFPPDFADERIDDSKQISEKKREELFEIVKEHALAYGIAMVSADEIDQYNIYRATQMAMQAALAQIDCRYDLILTDAMPLTDLPAPVIPIIKGDAQCLNIAGASILAKVTRDRYMRELAKQHPHFSFAIHKGYGTALHLKELEEYGPIAGVHRKSFGPVKKRLSKQLSLFQ